jgi:hypothetical protein
MESAPTEIRPMSPPVSQPSSGGPGNRNSRARRMLVIACAIVLCLTAAGGVAALFLNRSTATPSRARTTPTESSERPSLPQSNPLPDDTMAVRRNDSGDWKIETVSADGDSGTVLATGPENWGIMLTPDRRTVLYLKQDGGRNTLRAVSADGKDDRPLFSDGTASCPSIAQPAISPNGVLAVACLKAPHERGTLNLMSLQGDLIKVLDSGRVGDPSFTRDGKSVVYWRGEESDSEGGSLYRLPIDGSSGPILLLGDQDDRKFIDPACSPVDDRVALTVLRNGQQQIVSLDTSTVSPRLTPLTSGTKLDKGASWSPDGSHLAFLSGTRRRASIFVINASGSAGQQVITNEGYLATPIWTAR